jgi:hypothetical protein
MCACRCGINAGDAAVAAARTPHDHVRFIQGNPTIR